LLLETVVAIIVFALIGTTVLAGVSTARRSGAIVDNQSVAENIARNQMEYTFSRAYKAPPLNYASISDLPGNDFNVPSNFTVTATAVLRTGSVDPNLETVRVTVNLRGEQVLVLETIRGRN
jgi:type II secretory pathway pseudopilin PulG